MSDEYEQHRRRSETSYLLEYEAWEASLSDGDRAVLGKAAAPDLDSSARLAVGFSADVATQNMTSDWPDIVDSFKEDPKDILREKFDLSPEQAKGVAAFLDEQVEKRTMEQQGAFLIRIVGGLLSTSNVKLAAAGLAFASGLAALTGCGSLREWSRENGQTPAGLSKAAGYWRRELGLPDNQFCKDEETREKFSLAQIGPKHWRNRQ